MKRKIARIVGCFLAALALYSVLGLFGVFPFPFRLGMGTTPNDMTDIERIKLMLKNTYPTDILVMGDAIPFGDDVSYRKVDRITEEALQKNENCSYTFVFINDLNTSVQLTEDEINLLADKISTEDFCLVYLGETYAAAWDLPDQPIATVEGNLGYRYFTVRGLPRRSMGAWCEEEQELYETYPDIFPQAMLYEIEAYLLEVN